MGFLFIIFVKWLELLICLSLLCMLTTFSQIPLTSGPLTSPSILILDSPRAYVLKTRFQTPSTLSSQPAPLLFFIIHFSWKLASKPLVAWVESFESGWHIPPTLLSRLMLGAFHNIIAALHFHHPIPSLWLPHFSVQQPFSPSWLSYLLHIVSRLSVSKRNFNALLPEVEKHLGVLLKSSHFGCEKSWCCYPLPRTWGQYYILRPAKLFTLLPCQTKDYLSITRSSEWLFQKLCFQGNFLWSFFPLCIRNVSTLLCGSDILYCRSSAHYTKILIYLSSSLSLLDIIS